MGYKYYIVGFLNGHCLTAQEHVKCNTFLFFLINIIRLRFKYPIVDAKIRNGYKDCDSCYFGENKPLCDLSRKGSEENG